MSDLPTVEHPNNMFKLNQVINGIIKGNYNQNIITKQGNKFNILYLQKIIDV